MAAPSVPSATSLSAPALTVMVLAAVRAEAASRLRLRPPVLTMAPAPLRPSAKLTSVFGRSRVRVLPAGTAARAVEMSVKAPSKRIVESPPTTRDLNGACEAAKSARTRVPWSSWKVPANLPPAQDSSWPSVRVPAPVFTTFALSSATKPPWPSSTCAESSGWAKATAKAPVSRVSVEPTASGASTLEASDEAPGAAA